MSPRSNNLQRSWLNTILHTSAFINTKKQELLKANALKSFINVLTIVASETFLSVISIPLYLTDAGNKIRSEKEALYKLRRAMTLVIITPLVIIWFLKFVLIGTNLLYFNPQENFATKVTSPHQEVTEYDTAKLITLRTNPDVEVPVINSITVDGNDELVVKGSAKKDSGIVVYVAFSPQGKEGQNFNLYLLNSDEEGKWELRKEAAKTYDYSGKYTVRAFVDNSLIGEKSKISSPVYFTVDPSLEYSLIRTIDAWLNILMFAFLGIGIFLVILTLNVSDE